MKTLLLAVALAALNLTAHASATHDARSAPVVSAPVAIVADAGRLGGWGDTGWTPAGHENAATGSLEFNLPVDTGTVLIGLGLLALILPRPLGRLMQRREQQRRATALASTLQQGRGH